MVQGKLSYKDRRGLQVNARVFNAHHNHPPGTLPRDGQGQRQGLNQLTNSVAHLVAIGLHCVHRGPVVMRLVQVIPGHFIHTHGKQGLKGRVDTLVDQLGENQFVDIEDSRVTEVENQRVAQWIRTFVKTLVILQDFQQGFVNIERRLKILEDLRTF